MIKIPIKEIGDYCKSLSGILTFSILIVSGASSWYLRHDAKVIKNYVDSTQVKTNIRFTTIENSIVSLTGSVNKYVNVSNENFTTVKSEMTNHIQKSADIKPDERINDILRLVNGINTSIESLSTELKKKD
jgi:hypothetical protein